MKRIGLYPGSFDPFHTGHENIASKAVRMFDEVIIGIGVNQDKGKATDDEIMNRKQKNLQFILDTKTDLDVTVEAYQCLTVDLMREISKRYDGEEVSVTLIRGLRDGNDLEYETRALRFNQGLMPDINVIMIICDSEFSNISSTAIRNGDLEIKL